MILRRLYLYLVSAASLALLATGLVLLGDTALLFVFNDPSAEFSRGELATSAAITLVALPVWAVHFFFAQRFAYRNPFERTSALRHLYFYGACLAFSVASLVALALLLTQLLSTVFGDLPVSWLTASQMGWSTLVFVAIFALHFLIAGADRAAVGEEGTSATLRRWYMYPALLTGLLVMLANAQSLLSIGLTDLGRGPAGAPMSSAAAGALAGAVMWGFHGRVIATRHLAADRHSTLRAVEGFLAVAVCIVVALVGAGLILYYALARALGVTNPGGAASNLLEAAAGPVSLFLVFGVAWFLTQRRLARDAETQEAERQAGVRRLYTNLTALVSLGVWAIGAGGLLWTLSEQISSPILGISIRDWKDPVSRWVTLLVVGLAVWLTHWRQSPWAVDRQSFSRRLYVWAALLGSILGVLAGGVGMVNALLQQLFSEHPTLQNASNLDFGHFLAVILVAAGIGVYHWRILRADAAARPKRAAEVESEATPATVAASPAPAAAAAAGGETLGPHSQRYTLVVTDATEDDVHQALSSLPPQASYRLTPTEHAVDGR